METTQFKKIYLSTEMMDASQVSNYIENAFIHLSGDENIGTLKLSNDFEVKKHGLVGQNVDFSTGGEMNFAVGHGHHFYGKESFAVHDGNILGAKGIYYKAIDTENKKIYLSKEQAKYDNRAGNINNRQSEHPEYNSPYIGPKSQSLIQELFTSENGIDLDVAVGSYISLEDGEEHFMRCFKVVSVEDGSVISYADVEGKLAPTTTYFYNNEKTYWDSRYLIYFPDVPGVTCNDNIVVHSASFGCTALGDGNKVLGYNSFATGFLNEAEGHRSTAIGYSNKARGEHSIAIGVYSTVESKNTFSWSAKRSTIDNPGTFNINPLNGISGVYIDGKSLNTYLDEATGKTETDVSRAMEGIICNPDSYDIDAHWQGNIIKYVRTGKQREPLEKLKKTAKMGKDFCFGQVSDIIEINRIGSNFTSISANTFLCCDKLECVTDAGSVLTSIGQTAFRYCSQLKHVEFGNVKTLEGNVFLNTPNLSTALIPNLVTCTDNAFRHSGIVEANYPKMTIIGSCSFDDCKNLSSIKLDSLSTYASNILTGNQEARCFQACSNLKTAYIPSLSVIQKDMFRNCTKISGVSCYSVTSILSAAFYACHGLKELDFGNEITAVPTIDSTMLAGSSATKISCYIPNSIAKETWATAPVWSNYVNNNKVVILNQNEK